MLDEAVDICREDTWLLIGKLGIDGIKRRNSAVTGAWIGHVVFALRAMAGLTILCKEVFSLFPVADERGGFTGRALFAGEGYFGSHGEAGDLGGRRQMICR